MGVFGRGPLPAPSHAAEAAKALTLGLLVEGCGRSLGAQEDLHLAWVLDFFFFFCTPCPAPELLGRGCVLAAGISSPRPQASIGCSLAARVPATCGDNGAAGGTRTEDS